jgi:hypothetical protein
MKKDFWTSITIWDYKIGWCCKERKTTEDEYLRKQMYFLRLAILWDFRLRNPKYERDYDFIMWDLRESLEAKVPKWSRAKFLRDWLLSTWNTLRKLGCEDLISKEFRDMYKEDLEKYIIRMWKLQEEFNLMIQ